MEETTELHHTHSHMLEKYNSTNPISPGPAHCFRVAWTQTDWSISLSIHIISIIVLIVMNIMSCNSFLSVVTVIHHCLVVSRSSWRELSSPNSFLLFIDYDWPHEVENLHFYSFKSKYKTVCCLISLYSEVYVCSFKFLDSLWVIYWWPFN